ncbi:MAG: hypothetical protein IH598_14660 [Bacteroidales bacterium]|nr:hypothetical protein [Bacteroidales bacterium]
MMKKIAVALLLMTFVVSSCQRKEVDRLKQENEKLQLTVQQREDDINSMISILNEIEENLTNVRAREERLLKISSTTENKTNKVDDIKQEIMAIDELMRKNRENLELLSQRLKTTTGENQQLEKMIANLNSVVESKDLEIQTLLADMEDMNLQINDLYSTVTDLKVDQAEKEITIDQQDKALHRGYYLIGLRKEMREQGILIRSGGFLGLGKVDKLADNLDPSQFTMIDIRENTVFPIDAEKINLLTVHPSDSYLIRNSEDGKRVTSFEITRVEDFWKASRFLVLSLD